MNKILFIIFAAGVLVMSGCSTQKQSADQPVTVQDKAASSSAGQIEISDNQAASEDSDFDLDTGELESELDLSELDDIGDELDGINW